MFSYLFGLSRRWEMIFMLCSGVIIVYTLRVNMSVAAPKMQDDLGWSDVEKGYVLSSFYWGYAAGQLPASYVAQLYGSKVLFGLSVFIPSVLTIFVPVACKNSFALALSVRCMIGFFESASFPAIYHFFPHWIPIEEKTVMVSTTLAGMFIGEIIAFSLSGYLVDSTIVVNGNDMGSWSSVFYVFGAVGVLWFPYWMYMAYETPDVHPFVTEEEKAYIKQGKNYKPLNSIDAEAPEHLSKVGGGSSNSMYGVVVHSDLHGESEITVSLNKALDEEKQTQHLARDQYRHISVDSDHHHHHHAANVNTPWLTFFTTPASITLLVAGWTNGWIGFLLLSEMPTYFTEELGFDLSTAGILCIAPYAGMLFTTLFFGELFKYLQLEYGWKTRTVRQTAQFIAFFGASLCLLIAAAINDSYTAFAFVILSQMCLGANQSGLACAYLDIAPNFSGQFNTAGNTLSAMAGILGPIVVAQFTDAYSGKKGWMATFILTAATSAVSLTLWAVFQTSEIIPALNTPKKKYVQ